MKNVLFIISCFIITTNAFGQQKGLAIVTKSENDLVPEGIALDKNGVIYISSINKHKIIAIDKEGRHEDFIASDQDGYLEGLGMKPDLKANWLWAISGKRNGNLFTSKVQAFHLTTKKVQQSYSVSDTMPHLFNDLQIEEDGTIYLTDTYYSAIYTINPRTKKMALFLKSKQLNYPNGITSGKGGKLYVATYENGIVQIDKKTKKITPLKGFKDSTLAYNLDGLVYWNNRLFGVFNTGKDRATHAVVCYCLNDKGDAITKEEMVERGNPYFYEPTTIALKDDKLYVLANSHLGIYNANKESTSGKEDALTPVVVLQYSLSK